MPKGKELFCREDALWERGGLRLNPRMASTWRERILATAFPELAGHVWLASSGTGGSIKIIALSKSALEASAAAVNGHLEATAEDVWLNPLPLFHVGGLGIVVRAAVVGARWEAQSFWDAAEFVRLVTNHKATLTSLVPTQVHDLVRGSFLAPPSLRAVVVGGGALEKSLQAQAAKLGWPLLPSYGLTEAASQVATARINGDTSPWLPLLPHIEVRLDAAKIMSLRGPSLLTGWMLFEGEDAVRWENPKVDGWLQTQDRCELQGGMLRMMGRTDDLVKVRGELVDVGALERALQAQVPTGLVRVDVKCDARNGATLHVVAEHLEALHEAQEASSVFPPYARPTSFRRGRIPLNSLGKKIRFTG